MTIPSFLENGYLPEGIYKTTLKEIKKTFGSQNKSRKRLFKKSKPGIINLFQAGANKIWIDGSFTTNKEIPNDIDGIWEPGRNIDMTILDHAFLDPKLAKKKFDLDLYINGIEDGSGLPFTEFFQNTRDGKRKGILLLERFDFNQ